jgi:hypothetical protein
MVNFKKVLGLAAPALVFAGMAFGQTPVACTLVSPAAPYIRAEGTTELLPQIQVTCPTGTTLPSPLNAQVFITPVVSITSKVLSSTTGATEASASATTAGPPVAQGTVSGNAVTFSGITPASGTAPFVISNIRINASQIPVASGIPNAVNVSVFITSGNAVVATVAAVPVAYVVPGLATSKVSGAAGVPVCNGSTGSAPTFTVTVADFFPGAFKTGSTTAGPTSETSSLLTSPTNAVNSGTRVKLVFSNVPTGVTVYVPTSVVAADGSIINLTASETGAFSQVAASTATGAPAASAAVAITGGGGQAVYESTVANATTIDSFAVGVYLVAAVNGVTPSPTPVGVAVSFAPIGSTNIPNFVVGSSTTTLTGSSFAACATNLLFSYITNQAGYDTGLAISNTSTDPFGSKLGAQAQAGTCTLNFYGAGAPAAVTTPSIPSGTVATQVLSSIAPGFQGYMIAQCNFLFGHGFAFITNGIGSNGGLSEGYLASVIPDVNLTSGRKANPAAIAGSGTGESLGN